MVTANSSKYRPMLHLVYPCHICKYSETGYSKATTMLRHIRDIHGIDLPHRRTGIRRPANPRFNYQTNMEIEYDDTHLACPSCWYHTEDIDELREHIAENHDSIVVETKPFVYEGDNPLYERKAVNIIFEQINDISNMFKNVLRM